MTTAPTIGIVLAPGINRDGEAARAVELAGGTPRLVRLADFGAAVDAADDSLDAVIVPGGFSYGDALGAGRRFALEVAEPLRRYAATGRTVLGICNGFQTLAHCGLFGDGAVTLAHNANGRFECRWVTLRIEAGNPAGLPEGFINCPVAHGEGRVTLGPKGAASVRPLFRYVDRSGTAVDGAYPYNPNGSALDLAGVCNDAGNVWGLMPHPEDHIVPAQDPFGQSDRGGLVLFNALVERARRH